MNILMLTNTYTPFLGGVPRSVQTFTDEYRRRGNRTIVVAPEFPDAPEDEEDVIRVPALKEFNSTSFSVRLPIPGLVSAKLKDFTPDIVHSHHPFLMGDTALRIASDFNLPLIFTHHTLYEEYTHYLPIENENVKHYVVELATEYANLCEHIFAPSRSVSRLIHERGVERPISVVPTGIDVEAFASGDGERFRKVNEIPQDAFVVGHLGRLAEEKNLPFLATSVARFLEDHPKAFFLIIGHGPSEEEIKRQCASSGAQDRMMICGRVEGQDLYDAYNAMDLFAFASHTETQGLVVLEAMAAGNPVVAVDASGVRDVLEDGVQGRLLPEDDEKLFAAALSELAELSPDEFKRYSENALARAKEYSTARCASRALTVYELAIEHFEVTADRDESVWDAALRRVETEWNILSKLFSSLDWEHQEGKVG